MVGGSLASSSLFFSWRESVSRDEAIMPAQFPA